jgi:hypothetical protein
MKLVVTIESRRRNAPATLRELNARYAEFAAALRLVSDKIANSGAAEGSHDFDYGELRGTIEVAS